MGGRSATMALGIVTLGVSRERDQKISLRRLPTVAYFGFVVPDGVDSHATYFVPSNLGEKLENWQSSATSTSSTSQT
jgi:hypothetical protein